MDENQDLRPTLPDRAIQFLQDWGVMSAMTVWSIVAIVWLTLDQETGTLPSTIGFGVLSGATFILSLTQWINRRHDPRHAKRPPDAS
jgi:cyanate permease